MSDEDNRQDNWPMGWTLQEIKEHIDALEAQVRELQVKVDEFEKQDTEKWLTVHTNLKLWEKAEVKRLREELDKSYQERDKNSGALNMALEHLGYQGADHEQFCKEQYECNVYGDELIKCDNIECGGFLVNRYGDCISTISLSESAGCEDEDCCNYYKGSEEE